MFILPNFKKSNDLKALNLSFKGYRGSDWYGLQENKDTINYKIQLTPKKIDTIMKQAKTTDDGLFIVYKTLSHEAKPISNAFKSFNVICKQYMAVTERRLQDISKMNPKGSKVPVVSIIPQATSMLSGSFQKKLEKEINDLFQDFHGIVDKCFNKRINQMITDYLNLNIYVKEGIQYVTMLQGESPLRNTLLEKVTNNRDSCINGYTKLGNNLKTLEKKLSSTFSLILEKQIEKQSFRLLKKTAIKLITFGVG